MNCCKHVEFEALCAVNRFEDTQTATHLSCGIDLTIVCAACKAPMHFNLPYGLNNHAAMSVDGLEARIAGYVGEPGVKDIPGFTIRVTPGSHTSPQRGEA